MHREWIFKLGRLPSHGRVAHFLCETDLRLRAVGLSDAGRFHLPLTQMDVAEICGLTSIHVNRVMRDLRERGLCTFRSGIVEIHDLPGLARIGEFDPAYLYLDGETAGQKANPKRTSSAGSSQRPPSQPAAVRSTADQGVVLLDGPQGVVMTMTAAAAHATGENLLRAASVAVRQRAAGDAASGAGPVRLYPADRKHS